jgi:hypothetical protein
MAAAKLIADKLFRAPWMVHLDRLVNYQDVGLVGRSRPDLAGVDERGRWLVIEGKGRTGRYSKPTMDQAKAQVRQVRTIDGVPPYLRIGCQLSFDPGFSLSIVDSDTPLEESADLKIERTRLQDVYYKRFESVREQRTRSVELGGVQHDVMDIDELGVCIGIAQGAEARMPLSGLDEEPAGDIPVESDSVAKGDGRFTYRIFSDGLSVGLSSQWDQDAMSVVPNAR